MCSKQVQNKLLVLSMSRNLRKQFQKCTQITSDGPTPILDTSSIDNTRYLPVSINITNNINTPYRY